MPPAQPTPSSSRSSFPLIALALIVAIVGGLGWWLSHHDDAPPTEAKPVAQGEAPELTSKDIARKLRQARDAGFDTSPARATGRVTAKGSGAPVIGAVVLVSPKSLSDGYAREDGESPEPVTTRSKAGGVWRVEGLPAGRYTVAATAAGYLPGTLSDVRLAAGEDNGGLDVVLDAGGHMLSGTVSDIGGGPVEGALVRAMRMDDSSILALFDKAPFPAMTDDEGHYALSLPEGMYAVSVYHADYQDVERQVRIAGGDRTLDLSMTPGGVVEGRVVTREDKRPVAGAIVTTTGVDQQFAVTGFGMRKIVTDERGRFRIRGLDSGVIGLVAVADGYATRLPTEVALDVADQVTGVEVIVDRSFKITGFVVRQTDKEAPIEGVLLGAFAMQPPSLSVAATPSASDGYFEILGLQPGGYMVGAIGEDVLPNLTGTGATIVDEDVTDLLVVMDAGVRIRGRVDPPVAATVVIELDSEGMTMSNMMGSIGSGFARARTDEEGNFDLGPIAEGTFKVVANADDGMRGEESVEVAGEDVDGVVVSLQPQALLAGVVTDAGGQPVVAAHVELKPRERKRTSFTMSFDGSNPFGAARGTTLDDGSFEVRGLEAGAYDIVVKPERGPTLAWADPDDPEKPAAPIRLELEQGEQRTGFGLLVEARNGVITGIVRGADGEPLPDVWVRATWTGAASRVRKEILADAAAMQGHSDEGKVEAEMKAGGNEQPDWGSGQSESPVLTDPDGRFEITGLRDGTYNLVATAMQGSARARVQGIEPGSDVVLQVEALSGIDGKVTFKGKAVQTYSVSAKGPTNRSRRVFDPSGRFAIDRLDPGSYSLMVECEDGVGETEVELASDGDRVDVDIEIGGWGTVTGTLVDGSTGEPISGMAIMVQSDARMVKSAMSAFAGLGPRTKRDGSFRVEEVPPGEGSIIFLDRDASGQGGFIARTKYELEAGGETDLGTVTGVKASSVPEEERGELGLTTRVATLTDRPLAEGAKKDDEDPEDDDGTTRLWIDSVIPDGPAAAAGVQRGDEVISIDGVGVAGSDPLAARTKLTPGFVRVGQTLSLDLRRGDSNRSATVTARERGGPAGG